MKEKLNAQFEEQLKSAGYDKEKLLILLNGIDSTKKSISSRLSRLSSEPGAIELKGTSRQVAIRRMKDKIAFLNTERECVVRRLAESKRNTKLINREMNRMPPAFTAAFVAATRLLVDRKTLNIIDQAAHEILSKTHF
ncbi:TPA: hypothetical protein KDZ08_004802 [Vibrio parahaemolyticus]|uniref:hypothetical protein n=1 Tax=Vibrio TaxID=662 RepID=UPI001B818C11|nr:MULTISPECIES: hypothetical protein [Vibrio]BDP38543.1 hypothetical protein VA208B3_49140 [Vibrio alginolyticus]MCR9820081.1 hypothetical protein [Vibrio parahaemolyticus]BDP33567.1 hypothetical protein VV208B2_46470 [Vibrio vulnificus]HBC3404699.1 hypothetical protein [Vibrio parahaemolyticus]HBC3540188.1 hypothetical protein [Vibrio parahaemolyticus]